MECEGIFTLLFELPQVFQTAVIIREKATSVVLNAVKSPELGGGGGTAGPPTICSFIPLRLWEVGGRCFHIAVFFQKLTSSRSSAWATPSLRWGSGHWLGGTRPDRRGRPLLSR